MQTLLLAYLLAAGAASALFVAVGLRSTYVMSARMTSSRDFGWTSVRPHVEPAAQRWSHVDASFDVALKRLGPVIASRNITIDVALLPALAVPVPAPALADILEALVSRTIHGMAAGRLLMTAWESDGRIAVRAIGDAGDPDPVTRNGPARGLTELVSLYCGTVNIDAWATGSIVTIWLPGVEQRVDANPATASDALDHGGQA